MNFIRRIENIFEKYIEGFFNRRFSSEVQPVEIARQLVKEMEEGKSIGISKIYAPNVYNVYINSKDFEKITSYSQPISKELVAYLQKQAQEKRYTILGVPILEIQQDDQLGRGAFRIVARFSEPLPQEEIGDEGKEITEDNMGDTRVFDKVELSAAKPYFLQGQLIVIEGSDANFKVAIGFHRVSIGRRASNELPLTDLNTSRLQAYVVCEDNTHVIYDAKSLNGTYVNGHRILRKELQSGDKIKMGNTVILYEVK